MCAVHCPIGGSKACGFQSGVNEAMDVFRTFLWAAVAEWYRYQIVACLVTSSSPVPLKTRRVGQRCTLNLSRAETSSRWCGVVVRRGGASSGVVHVTWPWLKITWSVAKNPRAAEQCDVNFQSINQSINRTFHFAAMVRTDT
ncbi:uncharacterized protein TNCV_3683411 [Trichonephila clavipes]|nr:uncharacterized protein TNCV_3683411 [Trichonephila clavipes]